MSRLDATRPMASLLERAGATRQELADARRVSFQSIGKSVRAGDATAVHTVAAAAAALGGELELHFVRRRPVPMPPVEVDGNGHPLPGAP